MKEERLKLLTVSTVLLVMLFGGCAQKTTVKAIKAAKVTDSSIKNIGVVPFENDDISQSSQIDSSISNVEIKGKKYFTLVDRDNLTKVMGEKKLNDSGLVDLIKENSTKGLAQMETLVVGNININNISSSTFKEQRTDYDTCIQTYTYKGKTYCKKYRKYNVNCKANIHNVKTKVKLIKISDSKTIFTDTYDASAKYKHCEDDSRVLPSKQEANSKLAGVIADKLIKDIAPSYIYFRVTLLDDLDVELTDAQEKIFENSLDMIKHQRIEKANKMLSKLNEQLNSSSYVVLYNLSVTEESLGNIQKALELLTKSEELALEKEGVIEEITVAVTRMKNNLKEQLKVNKQL